MVLDDHIVHIVAESETVMPEVVLRDHAGEVVCEAELPALLATDSPGEGLRAWGVRGQFAVVQAGSNEQRRTLLLQP